MFVLVWRIFAYKRKPPEYRALWLNLEFGNISTPPPLLVRGACESAAIHLSDTSRGGRGQITGDVTLLIQPTTLHIHNTEYYLQSNVVGMLRSQFVHFVFSLGLTLRPGRVMLLMCLSVCVFVPPLAPQKQGPLGTFCIPWTFRYLLDTLNEDEDKDEGEDEDED